MNDLKCQKTNHVQPKTVPIDVKSLLFKRKSAAKINDLGLGRFQFVFSVVLLFF